MGEAVKDWIVKIVQEARQVIGVGGEDWSFIVHMTDKPGGDPSNAGFITVNGTYQDATIELRDDIEDDQTGRAEIYHEVLHAWHQPVDEVIDTILDETPDANREILRQFYRDRLENQIQKLSRSLVANIKKERK